MELDAAVRSITRGISDLRPSGDREMDLPSTMQSLAMGFERLLKLTFIQASLHLGGRRPDPREMKRTYGHNVLTLTDDLTELVSAAPEYVTRPIVQQDLEFIRMDSGLRGFLDVLSDFGSGGRYGRLDEVLTPGSVSVDSLCETKWAEVEMEILETRADWPDVAGRSDFREIAASEVIGRLRRFARAVGLMWTLGALGPEGPPHYGTLRPLIAVRDEHLADLSLDP